MNLRITFKGMVFSIISDLRNEEDIQKSALVFLNEMLNLISHSVTYLLLYERVFDFYKFRLHITSIKHEYTTMSK